jgi:hypothetical protein
MAAVVLKTGADEVEFPEQGPINEGMLPLPGPVRTAVRTGLELLEVFRDLLRDYGLLHAV